MRLVVRQNWQGGITREVRIDERDLTVTSWARQAITRQLSDREYETVKKLAQQLLAMEARTSYGGRVPVSDPIETTVAVNLGSEMRRFEITTDTTDKPPKELMEIIREVVDLATQVQ